MFDENRTITVTLLDGETKIKIDSVPSDATVNSILSRLLALDILKDVTTPIAIKCDDTILSSSDYIDDDIQLVSQPQKTRIFVSFFIFLSFCIIHISPIVLHFMKYRLWLCVSAYVLGLLTMGILCLILKPRRNTFSDLWGSEPTNIIFIDVIVLFFQSLMPSFHLLQVFQN